MGKKRGNHSRLFDWTESLEIRKYVLVTMIKHATIVILFSFHHIAVLTSSKDGGLPGVIALHMGGWNPKWVDLTTSSQLVLFSYFGFCICQLCFMTNIKVTNMKNTAGKSATLKLIKIEIPLRLGQKIKHI